MHKKPEYYAELLKIEVTEAIYNLMEAKGVNKAELARKLGCKPPYITKLLRGTANITLDSLARIAFMLGAKLETRLTPLEKEPVPSHTKNVIPMPVYRGGTTAMPRQRVCAKSRIR
ncbi:MAG: helix-turn-helix domain-containing protein [Desulfocucumaceae bacterium]